ncbi:Rpn family recombination-promoting nuclease/putative transposase [Radiobacillus sp. PE A8.2]|uniref:Rpn family recombination-promoting nuclease/putative transposase n=1 Tax=Radiobacillus sp. PE A8.2 TaxID=3380349 RepID=UPI00388DACFF
MSISLLVREESSKYIHHDQLFKQLIHTFFAEFLEAFFPEIHSHIDFSSVKPLPEEIFTDLIEGESRRADIVLQVKLKGTDTILIIHVEPQSYPQANFHERMYLYFSLLYNKYRKPILPIAIFSYDDYRNEQDTYTMEFPFFHVLTFKYLMVELRKINWRNYIEYNNPVAAALLSKMGYTEKERVQVKKEFLRMIVKLEINPAKSELINGFFESYLSLNEKEEEQLMKEIKELSPQEGEPILQLPNSWRDKGLREGRQQGIQEGRQEGIQEGEKQGKREATRNIALEMLKEGLSEQVICKVTKLNPGEIRQIKKDI